LRGLIILLLIVLLVAVVWMRTRRKR